MATKFSPETILGDLAFQYPEALPVFERFGIQSCRRVRSRLAEVCREHRLPYAQLALALTAVLSKPAEVPEWPRRSLTDLTAHIVIAFHDPLRTELARVERLAIMLQGHGNSHRRALVVLLHEVSRLRDELAAHMRAEERELFPLIDAIIRGDVWDEDRGRLVHLRTAVEAEHVDAVQTLRICEQITDGFRPPDGACSMVHDLYRGVEEVQHLSHLHRDFEKGLLFPRVFALV